MEDIPKGLDSLNAPYSSNELIPFPNPQKPKITTLAYLSPPPMRHISIPGKLFRSLEEGCHFF